LVSHENGKVNRNVSEQNSSRVRVGKNLSEMFHTENGLKQTDGLSALNFYFSDSTVL